MGRSGPWLISVKTRVSGVPDYLPDYSCQGMFNSRIPVCCFLSLVSPLFLISSCHKWVEACRSQDWDQEMECMHGFPSLAFPYGERDYLRPSFDMDCLLTLWPVLLLVSSITCKVWSFDLYLKKLPCDTVCILTQSSINTLVPLETWVPLSFSLSLFISLSGWFSGAWKPAELIFLPGLSRPLREGALCLHEWYKPCPRALLVSCITQGILASFLLSLSYRRLRTTRFWSIKGLKHTPITIGPK